MDIAGGTGNYLFDIKEKYPDADILVNDFSIDNVKYGENTVKERGIENFRFTNKDCFDTNTYNNLDFKPNIIIISGIFELFNDNETINKAVEGVSKLLSDNVSVIYTGQPWHPQLKMIAFVLNSHRGQDWVMRRRSQRELDAVFNHNGIKKEYMKNYIHLI